MRTIVLIGLSCVGKSTIAEMVKSRIDVEVVDSDAIVSEPSGGNIYKIFLEHGRKDALKIIESRERQFLRGFTPLTDRPCLVAAGPALVSREPEWSEFVERVQPQFVYLYQRPDQVLTGLRRRRSGHLEDGSIAEHPNFGCWDEMVTTAPTGDGRWEEVDDETALVNIEREAKLLTDLFDVCRPQIRFDRPEEGHFGPEVVDMIIELLTGKRDL
jgi:shikimate kinase